jgi:hypothetical protein
MPLTTSAFRNRCANQNISLAPVLTAILDDYYGLDESLFDTIEGVSRHIRKEATPLANRLLEGNIWGNDTAAVALRRIINGTIQPAYVDAQELNFNCKEPKTISACSYAETAFSETIHEIEFDLMSEHREVGQEDRGCDVFVHNGEPIFLRKSQGEPSSLSLADITVNGVPYPRGSIFRVETKDEIRRDSGPQSSINGVREISIDDISSIGFRRLSIWALSPVERSDRVQYIYGGRRDIVTRRTIEELQASIQTALSGAEVKPKPETTKAPSVRIPYNHFVILSQLALGQKV